MSEETIKSTDATEETAKSTEAGTEQKETSTETKTKTVEEIEAEIKAKYESEADRRVTEALKKREKALKEEFADRERKAKLTEEQRLKEEHDLKTKEQAEKERELSVRALKLDLVDVLAENGMDLKFRDLISIDDLLAIEPEDRTEELKKKITGFKTIVDSIVENRVAEAKKDFLKGSTPDKIGTGGNAQLNTYDIAKKNGDVKGMIGAKIANRK